MGEDASWVEPAIGAGIIGQDSALDGARIIDRDNTLAKQAATDKDAFCRLYTLYYPRIYSFVLKRLGNVADSEDVTARTFEKALRCIDSFNPGKGSVSSWLYKIAINVTNDAMKPGVPARVSLDELAEVLVFEGSDSTAAVRSFIDTMSLLEKLDRAYQVVLVLKYFEDMDHAQMAEVLDCSKKAVSMRLTRALKALRKVMREDGCTAGGRGGG